MTVLGLSIWFYADPPSFASVINVLNINFDLYTTTAVLLICLSVFVIILTFFGCCGAARDNRCMLWTVIRLSLTTQSITTNNYAKDCSAMLYNDSNHANNPRLSFSISFWCAWLSLDWELAPTSSSQGMWTRWNSHSWTPWRIIILMTRVPLQEQWWTHGMAFSRM